MEELIVFIVLLTFVNSFNVDVKNTITYYGQKNSLFGYNGILQNNWLVISAPKGNITDAIIDTPTLNSPGIVYKCPVDFTLQAQRQCETIAIQPREAFSDIEQSKQFLGGSMTECRDNIVVCAHLWKLRSNATTGILYTVGRCHLINKNLRDVDSDRPFRFTRDELYKLNTGYHAAFGMIGFSAAKTKDPLVAVMSGPGLDEIGGFVTYREDRLDYNVYQALDGVDTRSFLTQSYIGYSIAVARFFKTNSCANDPVLLGMPRFATETEGHTGSVILVCDSRAQSGKDITILKQFFGDQIGSGFGYGIIVCDYNGDGEDDILVSAPFFSTAGNIDTGRVFVFLGTGNDVFLNPINETLTGEDAEHGRFGNGMASLGDITADGIDDIAISAPFEGSGVVYIFNGRAGSVNTKYSQKIIGKNIHPGIMSFGLFISESRDMDANGFPDFVVGSPLSDRITLLRGRPVVMVTPSLEVTPSIIPLNSSRLDCSPDDSMTPCTTVTICFSFTGPGLDLIETTYVSYRLSVDSDRTASRRPSRVHLIFDDTNFNNILVRDNRMIRKRVETCDNVFARVSSADRQFFSSIEDEVKMTMTYTLSDGSASTQVLPVLNPNSLTSFTTVAHFQTGCTGLCEPNLQVTMTTMPPRIIIGQTNDLVITITLINTNEPAFAPSVVIKFSSNTQFVTFRPLLEEGSVRVVCSKGAENNTVLCNCGNQLLQHQIAAFRLNFDVSRSILQQGVFNTTDIPLNVEVTSTAIVQSGLDDNHEDNTASVVVPVEFKAAVEINGIGTPEQAFISEETDTLTFTHSYDVYNTGPSPMISSELYIGLPLYNSYQKMILSWTDIQIDSGDLTTNCTVMPPMNESIRSDSDSDGNLDVETENRIKKMICNDINNGDCLIVRCLISVLDVGGSTQIDIKFDLDASLITFTKESAHYYITTGHIFPADTDIPFSLLKNVSTQVTSELYPAVATSEDVEPVNLWIIIGAVSGGVVLLIIIGVVLWKCGFFNRAKKEQIDEFKRKSNYYEKRKTQRLEAARSKAMSKVM